MSDISSEIMDKLTKVCLCKAIPRSTFKKVISEGADTLEKVQKATGAGSGPCNGKRCSPKILDLLDEMKEL